MNTIGRQVQATPAQVREARSWIADCGWQDITLAAIRRLSADAVVRAVQAHYCGGWPQFIEDGA